MQRLAPQTGCALHVHAGEALEIVDPEGEQVADIAIFAQNDLNECFSSGRTLDYNSRIRISTGATLYSNRSNALFTIEHDDAGAHDYLLSPCSRRMFEILREMRSHPSCHDNLATALAPYGVDPDRIQATFNAFMCVDIAPDGSITIGPPASRAGDRIVLRAMADLLVGLTACSSEATNNGVCKPIAYRVLGNDGPQGA